MSTKANDLVYPITYKDEYGCTYSEPSLTKLEYFAGQAMQGLLANPNTVILNTSGNPLFKGVAIWAVEQAKALIEALNERE